MADRPFAGQQTAAGVSDFEKGTSTAPFLLAPGDAPVPRGEEFVTLEEFSPQQLEGMSLAEKQKRYQRLLGSYDDFLHASAAKNLIPSQLLAAVILNELNDIGRIDLIGERLGTGSIGIAQIQVKTAQQLGLVDSPPIQALQNVNNAFVAAAIVEPFKVENRLRQPKFAIEAAARLIRHLIGEMIKHRAKPWQRFHGFSLKNLAELQGPQDLYRFLGPGGAGLLEKRAAQLIAAAYNSPDIIVAQHAESFDANSPAFIYKNATIHGANATLVADDLFQPPQLFH